MLPELVKNQNFNWGGCGLHAGQDEDDTDGRQVLAKSRTSEIMTIRVPNQDCILLGWWGVS